MIYCGDALDCLELVDPHSVQCCIAHPPYWQAHGDQELGGEKEHKDYLNQLGLIFAGVRTCLIPTGDLWIIVDTLDVIPTLEVTGWFLAQTLQWKSEEHTDFLLHFYAEPQPGYTLMDAQWEIPMYEEDAVASLEYYRPLPHNLVAQCIQHSTELNDIVLDLFCGTGSTTIAARRLARQHIAIDIDPIACTMLQTRLKRLKNG